MEFFGFLILIGIAWWVITAISKAFNSNEHSSTAPVEIPLKVTVTTSFSSGGSEPIDTGAMRESSGGYVLNPRSPLPLTLVGLTSQRAKALKAKLDVPWIENSVIEELALLIAKENLRCPEVEAIAAQMRHAVDLDVESARASSPEWPSASERDREDLRATFTEAALERLTTKPARARDLAALLDGPPKDTTADDALLARFGNDAEGYRSYMYLLAGARTVRTVPADDYYRKRFEKFAAHGLARRGQDIPLPDILGSLRLKDLNELLKGTVEKPVGRKAKAVELALALPDIKARLGKTTSFRELFQITPPEGVDVGAVAKSFKWASAAAELFCFTYSSGNRTLRTLGDRDEYGPTKWKIVAHECCSSCSDGDGKTFKRRPSRLPPFHLGCSCWVEGVYD